MSQSKLSFLNLPLDLIQELQNNPDFEAIQFKFEVLPHDYGNSSLAYDSFLYDGFIYVLDKATGLFIESLILWLFAKWKEGNLPSSFRLNDRDLVKQFEDLYEVKVLQNKILEQDLLSLELQKKITKEKQDQ